MRMCNNAAQLIQSVHPLQVFRVSLLPAKRYIKISLEGVVALLDDLLFVDKVQVGLQFQLLLDSVFLLAFVGLHPHFLRTNVIPVFVSMDFFEVADNDLRNTILNKFYCVLRLGDSFIVLRCKIFCEAFWGKALVMLPYRLGQLVKVVKRPSRAISSSKAFDKFCIRNSLQKFAQWLCNANRFFDTLFRTGIIRIEILSFCRCVLN